MIQQEQRTESTVEISTDGVTIEGDDIFVASALLLISIAVLSGIYLWRKNK